MSVLCDSVTLKHQQNNCGQSLLLNKYVSSIYIGNMASDSTRVFSLQTIN